MTAGPAGVDAPDGLHAAVKRDPLVFSAISVRRLSTYPKNASKLASKTPLSATAAPIVTDRPTESDMYLRK